MIEILIGLDRTYIDTSKAWTFYISKNYYSFPKSVCRMKKTKEGFKLSVPDWLMKKDPLWKLEGNCNVTFL